MRFALALIASFMLHASAYAQGAVYLAFANGTGGRPFLGYYKQGRFVQLPGSSWESVLKAFQAGRTLTGLTKDGSRITVRIDSVTPEAEYYEPILHVSYPNTRKAPEFVVLSSVQPFTLTVVAHRPGRLAPAEESYLHERATFLWRLALRERLPEDSSAHFELGEPEVHAFATVPNVISVRYPVLVTWPGNQADDRASFFFIYSRSVRRNIMEVFGHPEWAPADNSVVLTVRPALYFRMSGDPSVYFVSDHDGGWESSGMAVYELKTGRILLGGF